MKLLEILGHNQLYHNMNPRKAYYSFTEDALTDEWGDRDLNNKRVRGISATRNMKLATNRHGYGPFCLVLNKAKLQRRFKVIPIDSEQSIVGGDEETRDRTLRKKSPSFIHAEELIVTDHLPDLHLYVDKILFIPGTGYEDDDKASGETFVKQTIKDAKAYCKKYKIPFEKYKHQFN